MNARDQLRKMARKHAWLILALVGLLAIGWSAALAQTPAGNPDPVAPLLTVKLFLPMVNQPLSASNALLVEHQGETFVYENGSSCATCHAGEAQDAYHSNHYQWAGKLGSINDFCGYPDINWISKMTNLLGEQVDGGCSTCHAGMGAKPGAAGVENVDCLMCHSKDYKRSVQSVNGSLRFVPTPGKVTVRTPGREECLRCHIGAGGGPNNKRGDLEPAHIDPPSADFDVHMASQAKGGAGLVCIDCHVTQDHKIGGRGADLRIDEGGPMKRCADCHGGAPHTDGDLNRHTQRVACESCHIPAFARIQSTDMFRDFRASEVDHLKNLYEPALTRQANVTPVYAFWNGSTIFYNYGSPANNGTVLASPKGGVTDAIAKLFPFKLHHAMQAHDPATGQLIPLKMGILFQTGDTDRAIRQGAADAGLSLSQGYDFVETSRYMGIFHEVAPADQALSCSACHDANPPRVDFTALGYTPNSTRNGKPLCASCHGSKTLNDFYKLHDKHVGDKNIACSECHSFSR
jgi:hypothetical protein